MYGPTLDHDPVYDIAREVTCLPIIGPSPAKGTLFKVILDIAVGGTKMEREVLFERLYQLLRDTSEALVPQPEVNVVEGMLASELLSRWRDLCLELSGHSLEEFRDWARQRESA